MINDLIDEKKVRKEQIVCGKIMVQCLKGNVEDLIHFPYILVGTWKSLKALKRNKHKLESIVAVGLNRN